MMRSLTTLLLAFVIIMGLTALSGCTCQQGYQWCLPPITWRF